MTRGKAMFIHLMGSRRYHATAEDGLLQINIMISDGLHVIACRHEKKKKKKNRK